MEDNKNQKYSQSGCSQEDIDLVIENALDDVHKKFDLAGP